MGNKIRDFLFDCEAIDFGKGKLSKTQSLFYQRFNNEMISLCRSLPESAQTDSLLFLMRYSGIRLGDEPDFFANYYSPSWSVLYWLYRDFSLPVKRVVEQDIANAVTAHSMALFLHSLDDHLIDGQISASSLTLLLRSQAWTIMNQAFRSLAEGLHAGEATVRGFVDDYYSSIQNSNEVQSFDSYCHLFRKQMAIGMIAPILLSMRMKKNSDFKRDLEFAYGSFGIAWRLLDDIADIGRDIEKGAHSAIYVCLPKKMRAHWNSKPHSRQAAAKDPANVILNHVLEHRLVEKIKNRIRAELEIAESIISAHQMTGLAREFRCLADPLRNHSSRKE